MTKVVRVADLPCFIIPYQPFNRSAYSYSYSYSYSQSSPSL